ncbi:unnamed protein product [Miscanthus lutarioriparius]|uniref:Uncharacterized protein n=1 Tax=Miscanthus lutarioriparius TaxID=422564 RepID=A0A811RSV8_9POAL|nr:unnamed protein product [Miscanthus lutarioriparius]
MRPLAPALPLVPPCRGADPSDHALQTAALHHTVWKRSSMGFHGTDGFSVYDAAGTLAFRVHNYSCRWKVFAGELLLMDGQGSPLLALMPSLGLLFCGKDIEPVWGRKEFLKFIILVNSICGILAFCFAIGLFYVTGKESFL